MATHNALSLSLVKHIYPGQAMLFKVSSAASTKFIAQSNMVGVSATRHFHSPAYSLKQRSAATFLHQVVSEIFGSF